LDQLIKFNNDHYIVVSHRYHIDIQLLRTLWKKRTTY